jgi:hypothetical protein
MVYDAGVSGAVVLSSVSGQAIATRGTNGAMVDFVNGRFIVPAGNIPTSAIVSGTYAVKDFSIYFANQSQEEAIFTNKYYVNSRFNRPSQPSPPYAMTAPCIFVSSKDIENKDWAIDDVYSTAMNIRLIVLADNLSQVEDVSSLLCDAKHLTFPDFRQVVMAAQLLWGFEGPL